MNNPLVSIITICYNEHNKIENTIKSVISQTYDNIEYIIIDGGSTDGTIDIIKQYADYISFWISEKDKGIYDAMNKGFKYANGEWIIYVNSGDFLNDSEAISNLVMSCDIATVDIVYGDSIGLENSKEILYKASNGIPKYREIPSFRHGAAIMRKISMPNPPFDTNKKEFGFALDSNLIFQMIRSGKKYCHVNYVVLKYEIEGVSNNQLEIAVYNYRIFTQYGFKLIPFIQFLKSYIFQNIKIKCKIFGDL